MRPSCRVLLGLLFLIPYGRCLSSQADSLQMRMYHGLDEMGAGTSFFLDVKRGQIKSLLGGRVNGLYRRPSGSQGEWKSSGDYQMQIGRTFHANFDVNAIFQGDYYRFERFEGPSPLLAATLEPPSSSSLLSLAPPSPLPPQRINRSFLGVGGTFTPDTLLQLTSIIGQQWEKREGFDDRGISASLAANLTGFDYKGYQNDLDLYLEQEELGARLNRELRFNYGLEKQFTASSSDRLEIYYRQKRYDYHVWGTAAIGTRMDTDQRFRNQLRYDPRRGLELLLDTELVGSTHEDRTPTAGALREEVNTSNAITLRGYNRQLSGWTRMKFDWGAHEDATGLRRERGTSLEGCLSWLPSPADSLAFISAVRKRQYDTSDTANYDDRDRLRYEFDLHYGREITYYFRVHSRAQVTLEHLVYIFGQKSDQNHWSRIFRLEPGVSFEPHPKVHNSVRFELVANSTDYDFELDPAYIKSTIYRRYTAGDSLSWQVSRGWMLALKYFIDLEDGGRFLWDEWVQQISEEYRTHHLAVLLIRQTQVGIRFDAGLSLYDRKGWEYASEPSGGTVKSPFLYLSRWGPLLHFSYPSASGVYIEADGDLSWVHEWDHDDYTIVNLDVRVAWR